MRILPVAILFTVLSGLANESRSEIIEVGSGSYTTTFPGVDIEGRNGYPGGAPQLSGTAAGRPVPTNDWWSALLNSNHAANLFNYPLSMRTLPNGLDIGLIIPADGVNGSSQPISDISPVIVGVSGLSASRATVADYSDWTVTIGWASGDHSLRATSGIGMPFVYFRKASPDVASVTVNLGEVTIDDEMLLITNSQGGANFAVYAPAGSTWAQAGKVYTSTLGGKDYWSLAMLPEGNAATRAAAWKAHAYVEPTDTTVSWNYEDGSATLRTEFETSVTVHEGSGTSVIQGLLPHQWGHLAPDAPALTGVSITSIRGELKLLAANTFATERVFQGILPTLPAPGSGSPGFDPAMLDEKIVQMENDTLATWTDSYNEGQVMNRLVQTARIAHETGNTIARDKFIATIKERLEDWLTAEAWEVAFLFHYQPTWSALLGYPAGHGQDTNLNDHHFHWGYFIHAASFMEQFEPGWADEWGGMIDLLVRDAASPDRNDPLFPFLRSFSPFAGHAWANGFATFPFGNDQESSSESMQFNSALIHWGEVTGNTAIRDLGIYLYTTEQSAIEEYWLDINERTFKPTYGYSLASRIWGNGYDNQTFWTSDIAAAYGIELYPIHGGSFYLGQNVEYAEKLWTEMAQNTGVLNQVANVNLWHDIYWQFLAFTNAQAAIDLYNAYPDRELKFGVSDAQTYYWLHSMNGLGQVDATVTADHPLAAVFDSGGEKTYVAHNYTNSAISVTYSDGTVLAVPPRSLATSNDLPFSGTMSTPFGSAPAGNSVYLSVSVAGDTSGLEAVEFFDGSTSIGTLAEAPFVLQTEPLPAGNHTFYARLHTADDFAFTGLAPVSVGDIFPYTGLPAAIPGTIDPGNYDRFEGGLGQGITYQDSSIGNNGDYRINEYVDVSTDFNEGSVVGWISDGEWIEYTVEIASSGLYSMSFRYASGNDAGGGPVYLELDGRAASPEVNVPSTGGWSTFQTAVMNNVELRAGQHVLRLNFGGGELNLGELSFGYVSPLGYLPPIAEAGADGTLLSPESSVLLDGSGSRNPSGSPLTYEWRQVAGPVEVGLSDPSAASLTASGLIVDGLYRFVLTVDDGSHEDADVVEFLRGDLEARPPTAAILSPAGNGSVIAGQPLTVTVSANDADGEVERVELFNGSLHLATLYKAPFAFDWSPPEGEHELTVRVTDSDGLSTTSSPVALTANPPLPCTRASASGDFEYVFGEEGGEPTITFVPSRTGVGSGIVLFYYGVGGGPWPGYSMTPNVPFTLNASEGQRIGFYFTYSVPEGGERNTIGENMSYTIGTCGEVVETDPDIAWSNWLAEHFEPVELENAALEATLWGSHADPDKDGIPNLGEFVSGEDPLVVSLQPLTVVLDPLSGEWRVRWSRRKGLPGIYGEMQWSADGASWSSDEMTTKAISFEDGIEWLETSIGSESPERRFLVRVVTMP